MLNNYTPRKDKGGSVQLFLGPGLTSLFHRALSDRLAFYFTLETLDVFPLTQKKVIWYNLKEKSKELCVGTGRDLSVLARR